MNLHRLTAQHAFRRAQPALRSRRDFLKTASTATLAALAAAEPAFAGMSYDALGLRGATVAGTGVAR